MQIGFENLGKKFTECCIAGSARKDVVFGAARGLEYGVMTLDEFMNGASEVCIDERETYLIMFTEGLNGYVCPNEGLVNENRAVFKGTYRDCQIWVERRGISAALRYVIAHRAEVPELAAGRLTAAECLEMISRLPVDRSEG